MLFLGFIAIVLATLVFFGQFGVYKKDKMRAQLIGMEAALWFIAAVICFK